MEKKRFLREYFSIPNLMGYFRIVLAVVYLLICFDAETAADYRVAAVVIAVSMLTDFLDGKIARCFGMVTDWGKILDPVADKVTLGVAAASLVLRFPLAEKVVLVFLLKESFMAVAGLLLMRRGWRTEGALFCGKVCTAVLYAGSVLLLLFPEMNILYANLVLLAELAVMAGTLLSYVMLYSCAWRRLRGGADPGRLSLRELQREKKRRHRWMRRAAAILAPLYLVFLIVAATLPYAEQPDVSAETKAAFHTADFLRDGGSLGKNDTSAKNGVSGEQEESGVKERVRIIDDNGEALEVRLQMIANARRRVILSTFDFRADEAGLDLLAALLDAADRGVQVELFVDGFNSWLRMEGNPYFYALSSHPNGKILVYNRASLLQPWRGMGRMHDKYLIVDDTAFLLGGRNSFGYFLGDYEGHKNHDWDALVYCEESDAGAGVESGAGAESRASRNGSLGQLTDYYGRITALDCCSVFHDSAALSDSPSVQRAGEALRRRIGALREQSPELFAEEYPYLERTLEAGKVSLLANPIGYEVKEPTVFYGLMQLAQNTDGKTVIHTPYIICNDEMNRALAELGDRVVAMTNSAANNGNPFAVMDYLEHKQELIDTGVTILEYEGGISYHGKVMTFGDRLSAVGSFNMDMRSAYLDTELMLVIDSVPVNRDLREKMESYEAEAAQVETMDTYSSIPEGMEMRKVASHRLFLKKTLGWLVERLRFLL